MALNDTESIDFRVSSLPNIYGEKICLRILGTSELRPNVDALGFQGRALENIREAIANPYGMILVTGPTGSGKTTTLYTILNQLNEDDVNIVTAEDPVEYRLEGITQVNVRPSTGLTFDAAMRSFDDQSGGCGGCLPPSPPPGPRQVRAGRGGALRA